MQVGTPVSPGPSAPSSPSRKPNVLRTVSTDFSTLRSTLCDRLRLKNSSCERLNKKM
ncbi:mitochondrial import inner membrane translocase subunit TIM8 [Cryptococcus neoformans A5-35-17]|nr:mitochondrial import inner membrane translocase subunit TIM8 [Cryptococcus neoformans var. grubii A5-35-17]